MLCLADLCGFREDSSVRTCNPDFGRPTFGFDRRPAPWRLLPRSFISRFSRRSQKSKCPIRERGHAKNRGGRPRIGDARGLRNPDRYGHFKINMTKIIPNLQLHKRSLECFCDVIYSPPIWAVASWGRGMANKFIGPGLELGNQSACNRSNIRIADKSAMIMIARSDRRRRRPVQ